MPTQRHQRIVALVVALAAPGLRLHGFGIKTDGCARYGAYLTSADSQAWSYGARKRRLRCAHGGVQWEANCPAYASAWRDRVLRAARCTQLDLFAEFGRAA